MTPTNETIEALKDIAIEAAVHQRFNDIACDIGGDFLDRAGERGLSDPQTLHILNIVSRAVADGIDDPAKIGTILRHHWPELFDRRPEDICPPCVRLTHELCTRISVDPEGAFQGETRNRIRAIGRVIYRISSGIDLLIARSVVEEVAGMEARRELDRVWRDDLESIPAEDYGNFFVRIGA